MNIRRMQELAGVKSEFTPPSFGNVIDDFIKRDNPKIYVDVYNTEYTSNGRLNKINGPFYDLGGGENPIESPNNTVVDYHFDSKEDIEDEAGVEIGDFIKANLRKFKKLPPMPAINMSSANIEIQSPKNIAKTIDGALSSGGILVLSDHCGNVAEVMENLKNYKLIEINFADYSDNFDEDDPENLFIHCVFIK